MSIEMEVLEPVSVEDMDVAVEPETDYVQWLVEQLGELRVEDDIISILKRMTVEDEQEDSKDECLRTVQCPGGCNNECVAPWDNLEYGNNLQRITDSTLDECIRNVHCPGNCKGSCGDSTPARKIISGDGSPHSGQTDCHTQSGTVTATQTLPGWKSNQDGEGGSDPVLVGNLVGISVQLDQDSTQLGKQDIGRQNTAHCTETVHNKNLCTVTVKDDDRYGQTVSKITYDDGRPTLLENDGRPTLLGNDGVYGPALEVKINDVNDLECEGVVQKDEGLSIYDIPGLKYCPGGELPVYTYTGYKPSTSTKKDPTLVQLQVQVESEDFPEENSITKLIAEWEVRGTKPEDSLRGEEKKGKRRKSAQFQKLSNLFEGRVGVM